MEIGVATTPHLHEGGYNFPGGPTNSLVDLEMRGLLPKTGRGIDMWARPEPILERAAAAGCTRFGFGIEWARLFPGFDAGDRSAPPLDPTAIDGYRRIVQAARELGMEPVLTLHSRTWPRWLGKDPWSAPTTLYFWDEYLRAAASINDGLAEPIREWITFGDPAVVATRRDDPRTRRRTLARARAAIVFEAHLRARRALEPAQLGTAAGTTASSSSSTIDLTTVRWIEPSDPAAFARALAVARSSAPAKPFVVTAGPSDATPAPVWLAEHVPVAQRARVTTLLYWTLAAERSGLYELHRDGPGGPFRFGERLVDLTAVMTDARA